jgi:hypothetical protein
MAVCSAPMYYRVSRTRFPFYGPRIDILLLHTLYPRPSCFLSAHRFHRTPACVTKRAGLYVVWSIWHCSMTIRDCCLKHRNPLFAQGIHLYPNFSNSTWWKGAWYCLIIFPRSSPSFSRTYQSSRWGECLNQVLTRKYKCRSESKFTMLLFRK